MSALLSMTTRFRDIIGGYSGQLAFGQTACGRTAGHPVAKPLELLDVEGAQTVVLVRRKKHGNIPLLTADHNGFALRCVQKGGEARLASVAETWRMMILFCL